MQDLFFGQHSMVHHANHSIRFGTSETRSYAILSSLPTTSLATCEYHDSTDVPGTVPIVGEEAAEGSSMVDDGRHITA
jgi:hypothetical protein